MELQSLAWRTELSLISSSTQVIRHRDYLTVRSDRWPDHIWKNFLLFRNLPPHEAVESWSDLYEAEFPGRAQSFSIAFGWDIDQVGTAIEYRLREAGYTIERDLVFQANELILPNLRSSKLVVLPVEEPALWDSIIQNRIRVFCHGRYRQMQEKFERDKFELYASLVLAGRGNWFCCFLDGQPIGDMGIFLSDEGIARLEEVLIYPNWRHRGLGRSMILKAGSLAADYFTPRLFLAVCEPDSAASKMYVAIGFQERETQARAQRINFSAF